ncbi:hypothetical protein [Bremerella sp.]|uniref:hypothetical protein n=1 Tax=Bremerella sp. TaxID=2795602 RepID=UPI00391AC2FD
MSHAHAEAAPQVVVRADKYFVCSACGVLVEIPPEVVGQLVLAAPPAPQDAKVKEASPRKEPVTATASPMPGKPVATQVAPPRPRRPQRPKRPAFVGEKIDGLQVPSGQQLDRALKWVSFHLRVLDRQNSEINRLKKLLKQRSAGMVSADTKQASQQHPNTPMHHSGVPCPRPRGHDDPHQPPHAHEDVSMAPEKHTTIERGPPG